MRKTTNQVRIISGRLRGRKLTFPDSPGLRPTPDRVRETLFNWLADSLAGARCLDLFAGSGALGIEALSRGGQTLALIEAQRDVCRQLETTVERLALTSARVICVDALDWLRRATTLPFDVVFVDPPYQSHLLLPALALLAQKLPAGARTGNIPAARRLSCQPVLQWKNTRRLAPSSFFSRVASPPPLRQEQRNCQHDTFDHQPPPAPDDEIAHFDALAEQFWAPDGPFAMLHV